jgi:hypothetical protein
MKKVLKLQLSLGRSCNFKIYPILFVLRSYFEHYINTGVWSSNFTLRNLCTWDEQIIWISCGGVDTFVLVINFWSDNWVPMHIIVGLFEGNEIIR